jgi:hypothetical protein
MMTMNYIVSRYAISDIVNGVQGLSRFALMRSVLNNETKPLQMIMSGWKVETKSQSKKSCTHLILASMRDDVHAYGLRGTSKDTT